MTKKCELSGKIVMTGNNVSHAVNRSRRRFIPNIQNTSLYSEELGKNLKFKAAVASIRTVEKKGGIDEYLFNSKDENLSPNAFKYKKQIVKKRKEKSNIK